MLNNPYLQAELCPLPEEMEISIAIDGSQIHNMMYDDEDKSDSIETIQSPPPVQEDKSDSHDIQSPPPVMRSCSFCGVELEGVQLERHRAKCEEKTAKWATLRKDPKSKKCNKCPFATKSSTEYKKHEMRHLRNAPEDKFIHINYQ